MYKIGIGASKHETMSSKQKDLNMALPLIHSTAILTAFQRLLKNVQIQGDRNPEE
jgi:hypothetical protein